MGWMNGLILAMSLAGSGDLSSARMVFSPEICEKKRVDSCGCHHVYGIRHCHPNRKTVHCEAPVKADAPLQSKTPPIVSM